MTIAYSVGDWRDFGVAAASTAATLAGLVFVAVSINLRQILKYPNLPARAGQTLTLFATPLVVGLFVLVPGQPGAALGSELLVAGVSIGGFQLLLDSRSPRSDREPRRTWLVGRITPAVVSCGCLVIAGGTLLARAGGGLYWLVPSVLAAMIFGLVNAWVLLVEILR
jgi:hypothetical protein